MLMAAQKAPATRTAVEIKIKITSKSGESLWFNQSCGTFHECWWKIYFAVGSTNVRGLFGYRFESLFAYRLLSSKLPLSQSDFWNHFEWMSEKFSSVSVKSKLIKMKTSLMLELYLMVKSKLNQSLNKSFNKDFQSLFRNNFAKGLFRVNQSNVNKLLLMLW